MGRVYEHSYSFMLPWSNFVSLFKGDGRTEFQIDFACHLPFLGFGVNGRKKSARWIAGELWIRTVQVWHTSWAETRSVRVSR